MLELARPWLLTLLLPLALLIGHRLRRPEPTLPQAIPSSWESRSKGRVFPPLAWMVRHLALGVLVVALAGPGIPGAAPPGEGIAIVFALDLSGSMETLDLGVRTRLAVATEEMARFIRGRPQDLLGLVTFGEEAQTRVPPTTHHRHLLEVLGGVEIAAGENGTALGAGLGLASQRIAAVPSPSKVVILLTDGRNNTGVLGPVSVVRAAATLGIRVHTVGIGAPGGDEPLDEALLRQVAQEGGGRFLRAQDVSGFRGVMEELDRLERGPIPLDIAGPWRSFHGGFLVAGILLLLLEAGLWLRPGGRVF